MLEHVLSGEIRLPRGERPDAVRRRRRHRRRRRRGAHRRPPRGRALRADRPAIADLRPRRPRRSRPARAARSVRAGLAGSARRRGGRARCADEVVELLTYLFERGDGRPQRPARRTACGGPRPRAAGLRRLRSRSRRQRGLGCGARRRGGVGTMSDLLVAVTVVTAVGCGLSAGALFAFSSFVMRALARLPASQGIAAMNSINVVAVTPAFMTALFGTGLLCVALAVWALVDWHGSFSPYLVAGGAAYLIGVPGVTMAFNVPRNDALAGVDPRMPKRITTGGVTSPSGRRGTTCGCWRVSPRRRRSCWAWQLGERRSRPAGVLTGRGTEIWARAATLAAPGLESLPDRDAGDQQRRERVEPPPAEQRVAGEAEEDGPGEIGADQVLCALAVGGRASRASRPAAAWRCRGSASRPGSSRSAPCRAR